MKHFTKLASLILALLMVVAVLVSCGETKTETVQTTASAEAESQTQAAEVVPVETEPVFPDANYGGAAFTVFARSASTYTECYIWAETENGDVMNDSTLKRNQQLQAKYNVEVKVDISNENPGNQLSKDIAAGELTYDIILDRRSTLASVVTSGVLLDVNTLNIDYTNSWWDINAINDYKVFGKTYFFVNDVSTSNLSGTRFLYWNKQIVIDYNLTNPYDLVAKNEWTLENFVNMVKGVSNIKADGSLGTYGMLAETGSSNGNYMHLFTGCGIKFSSVNSDGEIVCNISDNVDKLQNITDLLKTCYVDKVTSLTYDSTQAVCTDSTISSKWTLGRTMFAEGHFLFVQNGMGVSDLFNDMADDYGVLPNPKYDSNQERYYHKIDKYSIIWAVPNAASIDQDKVAKVMDYWSYLSSKTVMPAFYDITIRSKRISESTASANLDIVKNTISYELADLYCSTIMDAVNTGYTSGSIATGYKQYNKAIEASLKATNQKLSAQ